MALQFNVSGNDIYCVGGAGSLGPDGDTSGTVHLAYAGEFILQDSTGAEIDRIVSADGSAAFLNRAAGSYSVHYRPSEYYVARYGTNNTAPRQVGATTSYVLAEQSKSVTVA